MVMAARIFDMHVCPMVTPGVPPVPHVGGPVSGPCSANVHTGSMLQARQTDMCICVGPPDVITVGFPTVLVNGLPAARVTSMTAHGGVITVGCPTVMIGTGGGGGGGGAGSAATVGVSTGMSTTSSILSSAAAVIAPAQQAATYERAARGAVPFVQRCGG